mmetsp:Transcript_13984/g.18340  ORF Transcript_13984/g.18340 Transcript_13984/m.18340 type:complete len:404 (-) Transcript_13984:32-1243(-)
MDDMTWEEKYYHIKSENDNLKRKCNEQETTIRRMNTKLAQIEKSLRTNQKGGGAPRNKENEALITELYKKNAELTAKNRKLEDHNRKLQTQLERKTKEAARTAQLNRVVRGPGGKPMTASTPQRSREPSVRMPSPARTEVEVAEPEVPKPPPPNGPSVEKLTTLVEALKSRLVSAEEQLAAVRAENQQLRQEVEYHSSRPSRPHAPAPAPAPSAPDRDFEAELQAAASRAAAMARREHATAESEEILRLQGELRSTTAKLQLLQTRYDHLEAKAKAQRELQEGSLDQLEEYNKRLRDLRRVNQDLVAEKQVAEARADKVDDYEEQVRELRDQNRRLEERITSLCENPYISGAFDAHQNTMKLEDMEKREREAQRRIAHLQETAKTHHAALTSNKQEVDLQLLT